MTAVPERPQGAKLNVCPPTAPAPSPPPRSRAARPRPKPGEVVGVRLTTETLERVDNLRPLCALPGQFPCRSRVLARLVHEGLEALKSGEVKLSDLKPCEITPGRGRRALW